MQAEFGKEVGELAGQFEAIVRENNFIMDESMIVMFGTAGTHLAVGRRDADCRFKFPINCRSQGPRSTICSDTQFKGWG